MDITIIIPCFNREETIKRSINSVINQTLFMDESYEYEIIVVDDGSKDRSVEVIEEIPSNKIKLVKLIKNTGGNFARNIGIKKASGKYIAFQDSDDYWYRNKLELQLSALLANNSDIIFSSLISNNHGKELLIPDNLNQGFVDVYDFLDGNKMSTQVLFGKRECFVSTLFDERISRFQDWELALRLVTKYKVYFIEKPLATQYIQSNSITNNTDKAFNSLLIIEEKHRNLFKRDRAKHSKLYEFIGAYAVKNDKNGQKFFKLSLRKKFSIRVLLKLCLLKVGLYKVWIDAKI